MDLTLRNMTSGDKSPIMIIVRKLPQFTPGEITVAEEVIDSYLNDWHHSGYHILVAESEQSVIGYVCFGPVPLTTGTWDLYWIAVAQEHQAHGIGRRLMTAAEDEARQREGRLLLVETSSQPGYDKTRSFYESCGYEVISQIPDFYSPGDDKLTFRKQLDPAPTPDPR